MVGVAGAEIRFAAVRRQCHAARPRPDRHGLDDVERVAGEHRDGVVLFVRHQEPVGLRRRWEEQSCQECHSNRNEIASLRSQ